MRPVVVLGNPTANRGRGAGLLPAVLDRLRGDGCPVRLLDASDRATALEAAVAAVREGPAALVAVGGDGTVHLAVQAVAGTGTPLAVVPAGTGNDFAADVGIPPSRSDGAPVLTFAEVNATNEIKNFYNYTPAVGGPGYTGFAAQYAFFSDGAIPEPSTLCLVALGGGVLVALRRRRGKGG